MTEYSVPMRYDPDVYVACRCFDGPHKHGVNGPEPFIGLVFAPSEDGMLVSAPSLEVVRRSMQGDDAA